MMRSEPLPDAYRGRNDRELAESICAIKKRYGSRLLILGHHYQRPEVVALSDLRGDSFVLSREAASHPEADFIVFCGVHFMAECAAILCHDNQRVFHPDFEALCPMAAMADLEEVEEAWDQLTTLCPEQRIVPVTYVNSRAELKAFCGARGGVVCTSSNARRVFEWARGRGQKVFFFPDEHLGRNTANKLKVARERIILWERERLLGGNDPEAVKSAEVVLWNGYCYTHRYFTPAHIEKMRREYPGVKIIVHPECVEEVVDLADADGSTGDIVRYVEQAPPGSIIAIGTEINLIQRLAMTYREKTVLDLARSLCASMFRINLGSLLWVLEHLEDDPPPNQVVLDEGIRADAFRALDLMLKLN